MGNKWLFKLKASVSLHLRQSVMFFFSKACDWGIHHEPRAKEPYTERTGAVTQEREETVPVWQQPAWWISRWDSIFGDCIIAVGEVSIVSEKPRLSCKQQRVGTSGVRWSDSFPKQTHNYWHQIQGNLHRTRANSCHLITWTPLGLVILPVLKDPTWAVNIGHSGF